MMIYVSISIDLLLSLLHRIPECIGNDAQLGALLHKSGDGRGSPFPGRTYPTASVTGMPSAV